MTTIKLNRTFYPICALFLLFAVPAFAQQQESLTYDPQTGKYTMYYYSNDEPGKLERSVFELPNKIDPTIKSKVKISDTGPIRYEYKITNGKASKQNLELMRLWVSHAYVSGQSTPEGWRGLTVPSAKTPEVIVSWSYWSDEYGTGLKPSNSQSGFGYESRDLAGVAIIEARGAVMPSQREDYTGNMDPHADTEIGKQYWKLLETSEYVRRFAAAPKISVPDPFDTAVVLSGIQKHLNQDLVFLKLIDPVFASQLDRLLQAAIDAAKINATKAVRDHLKDLRKLLKKEHDDADKEDNEVESDPEKVKGGQVLIDKLAAKVLDFDFKYVEKRLK